jgi:hypothetical protein
VVDAHGKAGPIEMAELPPSLALLLTAFVDPVDEPFLVSPEVVGLKITAERASVRSGWDGVSCSTVNVASPIGLPELFESIGRLYRLPAVVGVPYDDFPERFGPAVVAQADLRSEAVGVL